LRALAKIGRDSRYPTFTAVLPVLRRAVAVLPGALRMKRARQLAGPRIEHLQALVAAIEEEAGEQLH